MKWFECVPNFSEGRDAERIERIVAPARAVPGVAVLDVERNADHHRSVVSLAGPGDRLLEAVFRMMEVAVREIDLNHHHGEHPRMGAVDVVPFIPLGSATMEEAIGLARALAERASGELGLPVYLYGEAARRPERRDLAAVRKGGFEGLRAELPNDPSRAPDLGPARVHPTAGIVAIGARPVLIAYNVYLTTGDVAVAKKVAHAVRGRDGGLAEVKALGFEIRERARAQVSMNLTDYRRTPLHRAFEMVRREAERYGVAVEESEVVGLLPEDALFDAAEHFLQLNAFDRGNVLERKLDAAGSRGSAADAAPDPERLARLPLGEFTERLAARTPTPGGGSAAAAVGALGTALGAMVIAYSMPAGTPTGPLAPVREQLADARTGFLELVDADARSYEAVRAARRALRPDPTNGELQRAWEGALRRAAEVPLDTARLASRVRKLLETHRAATNTAVGSDLVTALSLLRSAQEGALANVATNLEELVAKGLTVGDLTAELERLRGAPP